MIGKRIAIIVIAIVLTLGVGGGAVALYLYNKDDSIDVSAASVITDVTNKIFDSTSTIVSGINSQAESEDASTEAASTLYSSDNIMSLVSDTTSYGWVDVGTSGYVDVINITSPIIYALEYASKNATIENGYAYGFDYGNVYAGALNYSGFEGVIFFTCEKVGYTVTYYLNFQTDNSYGLDDSEYINLNLSMICELNKDGEVEKATINYVLSPYAAEIWVVEYDFVNNSFKGLMLLNGWNHYSFGAEIINKYNNGTFDFDTAMSYEWGDVIICSANITDDISKLSLNCYEYQSEVTSSTASIIIKTYYNGTYNNLTTNKLFYDDSFINKSSYLLINYAQDAVTYGENKGTIYYNSTDGTYSSTWITNYSTLINILSETISNIENKKIINDGTEFTDADINNFLIPVQKLYNYYISMNENNFLGLSSLSDVFISTSHQCWMIDSSYIECLVICIEYSSIQSEEYDGLYVWIGYNPTAGVFVDLSYYTTG